MPTTKKQRSCGLVNEEGLDILVITERTRRGTAIRQYYRVEKNPNAATAFRLHKMVHSDEPETVYDILIDGDSSTCDCIGSEQHRHCKHVESMSALIDAGKI